MNSIPFVVAKETRLFEKYGLAVDMVYVGASAVIVQSMLSGAANFAGFGGPAVITNVLNGGDIIQIFALLSLLHPVTHGSRQMRDVRSLQGKKIGVARFGSVTDFALRTPLERNNLKDVEHTRRWAASPKPSGASSQAGIECGAVPVATAHISIAQGRLSRTGVGKRLHAWAASCPKASSREDPTRQRAATRSCASSRPLWKGPKWRAPTKT